MTSIHTRDELLAFLADRAKEDPTLKAALRKEFKALEHKRTRSNAEQVAELEALLDTLDDETFEALNSVVSSNRKSDEARINCVLTALDTNEGLNETLNDLIDHLKESEFFHFRQELFGTPPPSWLIPNSSSLETDNNDALKKPKGKAKKQA